MQGSNWDILDSERLQEKGTSTTTWKQYTQTNWTEGNLDQRSVCNMGTKLNCAKMCRMPFLIKPTFSILLMFTNMIFHFGLPTIKRYTALKERHYLFPRSPLQTNSQMVQVWDKKSTGKNEVWNVCAVKQGIFSSRYLLNHPSLMLNCGSWHCWLKREKQRKIPTKVHINKGTIS